MSSLEAGAAVWGILLAAGESRRMGRPKALLALGGAPAACSLCRRLLGVCREVAVVTGYHAELVEAAVAGLSGVRTVRNSHPEDGQVSSLKAGLRAMPEWAQWFAFAPVDCFGMDESVVQALAGAAREARPEERLVVPQYGERRGHPVFARREVAAEFLALGEGATARDVMRRLRPVTRYVGVGSDGFLMDVDTPADYEAFTARFGGVGRDRIEKD